MIHRLPGVLLVVLAVFSLPFTAEAASYVLGPGDILSVTVTGQEDQREVRVTEDGSVSLPLVGSVKASGLTLEQLQAELELLYRDFIREPKVQIFVREYHSKEISVLGEVSRPGLYKLTGNTTLMEVLSIVGGLSDNAADNLIVLRRQGEGQEPVNIVVDTTMLFTPGGASLNVQIQDGDVIHVPKAEKETATFYVFGEVNSPGPYQIPHNVSFSVIKAITLAGGLTGRASKRGIKIKRQVGGQPMTFKVDMDSPVRPQDVIVVPESFF
jgi:polysaccharide export outer membrane protein